MYIYKFIYCSFPQASSDHVARALNFLRSKQRDDGGWGESYLSSSKKEYHHADESQVLRVNPRARMCGVRVCLLCVCVST